MRGPELVRRLGRLDAALFVVARALERLTGGRARLFKYYFMAQPVPRVGRPFMRATGIVVDELHAGDPRLELLDRPADELARRFAGSARCIAAWQGGALTGFLWFTDREYAEDEVRHAFRVDPADRAVWDLDVHIVPRYRRGRTFALLWEHAFEAMRRQGAQWTLSRVSAFKTESIRAHQRLGARRTGWALFVVLGSWQFTLDSRGQWQGGRLKQQPYPVMTVRVEAGDTEPKEQAPAEGAGDGARAAPRGRTAA
jgi:hypothetical protein